MISTATPFALVTGCWRLSLPAETVPCPADFSVERFRFDCGLPSRFSPTVVYVSFHFLAQAVPLADIKRSSSAKKRSAASPGAQGSQALPP